MPEPSLRDSLTISLSAQEPWPENVKLFQPYEVEQILLPDNASCLAVQAFLKMCNLPFEVEMRWNAEFMSPSGRVPFIKCGAFVVSELEPIVQFAANKGVTLCSRMSTEEKAEMRAYMSLITNVLVNAELYVSWLDNDTYNTVTKVRNSSVYPWPLGWLQTRSKRNTVAKRLKALHWHDKTMDQVMADVEQCCNSLSQRLGNNEFFFGSPTQLDALLYGHVRALLGIKGPRAPLLIKPITTVLLRHTLRVASRAGMKLSIVLSASLFWLPIVDLWYEPRTLPLQPQEDYLISQAHDILNHRRQLIKERSNRMRRSILSVRNTSPEKQGDNKNVYGFKPFATTHFTIYTTDTGDIACKCNAREYECFYDKRKYEFAMSLVDDLVHNSYELLEQRAKDKMVEEVCHDFEVIHSNSNMDVPIEDDVHVFLDTIDEVDLTDTTVSMDSANEDLIQVINESPTQENLLSEAFPMSGEEVDVLENGVAADVKNIRPSELDALVFGHVFTIITTRLPCRRLADIVRKHESLVALAKRIDERYFKRT